MPNKNHDNKYVKLSIRMYVLLFYSLCFNFIPICMCIWLAISLKICGSYTRFVSIEQRNGIEWRTKIEKKHEKRAPPDLYLYIINSIQLRENNKCGQFYRLKHMDNNNE